MNTQLLEELLYQQENEALDFKRDQYPFVGATNEEKGELLKDILAFANAWRQSDAYILIGTDENRGGRAMVPGVTTHLKDNDLQQFVNTKTNRPVTFSYEVVAFEGREIGVVTVPRQDRPFFLKNDFGKLKKHVVYVRRGSSTAEADPDEVGRMGAARVAERQEPVLDVQFAESRQRKALGTTVSLHSVLVGPMEPRKVGPIAALTVPRLALPAGLFDSAFGGVNEKYSEEKEGYVRLTSAINPLSFMVRNTSGVVAEDLRIEFAISTSVKVILCDWADHPSEPSYYRTPWIPALERVGPGHDVTVRKYEDNYHVSARIPKVQPGKTYWCHSSFYIGAGEDIELKLEAQVSADNLPVPLCLPLVIKITTSHRHLTYDDIRPPKRERGEV
jgi:hypothetical protein